MIIEVRPKGKFFSVEGDGCYLFYYLFGYQINHGKCYFRKRYLSKILSVLTKKDIPFKLIRRNIYIYI